MAVQPPPPSTLQWRVLRFVVERGRVHSRMLQEFGVSRQVVSLMVKRGLLTRVQVGLYEASEPAIRWLDAARPFDFPPIPAGRTLAQPMQTSSDLPSIQQYRDGRNGVGSRDAGRSATSEHR